LRGFSGEGGEAADLQQLDPQSLDLHEDAVQGRLIFEWTFQDRVGALSSRLEGGKAPKSVWLKWPLTLIS
jgi:hypothetical protein